MYLVSISGVQVGRYGNDENDEEKVSAEQVLER
jgi:hypothetical protein